MLNEHARSRRSIASSFSLMDSPPDPRFDRITRIAQRICGAAIATLSFTDFERQWFKSRIGMPQTEMRLTDSLCGYVFEADSPVVLHDTLDRAPFNMHASVIGAERIRFFAGVPIHAPGFGLIGCLALMDQKPKAFSDADLQDLQDLADLAGELAEDYRISDEAEDDVLLSAADDMKDDRVALALGRSLITDLALGAMLVQVHPWAEKVSERASLVWINRTGAAHLSVLHPGDLVTPLSQLLPPETVKALVEGVTGATKNRRLRQIHFPLTRVGETKYFAAKMVPCGDKVAVVFGNATDDVQTQLHAAKTLELFRQMTSLISHDMRGPLRRIVQFIDILRDEAAIRQPEHEEFFSIIQSQARALAQLLTESVRYSRTLMIQPQRQNTSIKHAIDEGFALALKSGDYGNVTFEAAGDWGVTIADPKLLSEAFSSLFGTMLMFRKPMRRPSIRVEATIGGGRQLIQISDNGLPIPQHLANQVFTFRARRPLASGEQQTLLGFSLAAEVFQDIGGDAMANPDYEDGTLIMVDLPLGRTPNPERHE